MKKDMKARFDYLMNSMINTENVNMELSKEEQEFFQSIDLTEVLFI